VFQERQTYKCACSHHAATVQESARNSLTETQLAHGSRSESLSNSPSGAYHGQGEVASPDTHSPELLNGT